MATSSLSNVINQNTPGNSQGFPVGVPTSYSWYTGSDGSFGNRPPSNFTSVTGWGQIYPQVGAPADPNASSSVQIADFETFVHLTNGTWVQVQNQSTDPIQGAHFNADFSGNTSVPWKETTLSDGSASVDAPTSGINDHFWPGARGSYAAGTVDGVFVEAQMKTSDPNANLVANVGADWWASPSAAFVSGFSNNPSPGMSDWVKLTTSYQTLYYSSLSPQALQADPPPGITASTSTTTPPVTTPPVTTPPVTTPPVTTPPAITPAVTQATAAPGTGVEQVGDKIALTLGFNEAVTVAGKPTLTLNDGSTATYVSGSGTKALLFSTTVASTNKATSALAITAVNLASGASIKDASGLSANLSGAAKTFSGLQINPTPPVTTPPVTTPPVTTPPGTGASGGVTPPAVTTPPGTGASGGVTPPPVTTPPGTGASGGVTPPPVTTPPGTGASGGVTPPKIPVLSVADHSLSVSPGHSVALGIGVTVPNKGDAVTVHVAGLPKYETITDSLDHKTFRGSSISLTAAEVNSGLTLTSHFRGHGDPSSTLSVTATDSTGKPVTSAAQTITVKDPPAAVASSGTSSGTTTNPFTSPANSSGHQGFAHWFGHHPGFAPVATTLSDAGASKSAATSNVGTATNTVGSAGAKSFALFNQMMAGDFGHDSHFAQMATASPTSLQQSATSLTKPLH